MTSSRHILALISLAAAASCRSDAGSDHSSENPALNDFEVIFLYADEGQSDPHAIADGILSLPPSIGKTSFGGSWQLKGIRNANVHDPNGPNFIAPLSGIGKLSGKNLNSQCIMEMYPGIIDDNIELITGAQVVGDGKWQYVTFAGVSASGVIRISPSKTSADNK